VKCLKGNYGEQSDADDRIFPHQTVRILVREIVEVRMLVGA
jgi:hypothetical protein